MIYFLLVLAIAALIAGIVLVSRGRGSGRPYPSCGACGYDVSGSVGSVIRCPECGIEFTKGGINPPRGSRSRAQFVTGCLLIFAAVGVALPAYFINQALSVRQQLMQAARVQAIQAQMAMQRAEMLAEASAALADDAPDPAAETSPEAPVGTAESTGAQPPGGQ